MSTALQTWRLASPCTFGRRAFWTSPIRAVGWFGPHHCDACNAETERGGAEFAAAVAAGTYDAQGYTPAERRAQQRKAAA